VADLPEHTGDLRRGLLFGGTPDPAQAERPQGAAVTPALADRAADLRDPKRRHP